MIAASFGAFLLLFVVVEVLSTLKNRHTNADYLHTQEAKNIFLRAKGISWV